MATQPLFAPTLDVLRQELRLSNLPDAVDAQAMVNAAVLATRVDLFRHLGKARVDEIKGFADNETPETEEEILRATARVTEALLVRWHLMGSLPMLFLDGGGRGHQEFLDEAPFRELSASSIEEKRSITWKQILENLELLQGDELGDEQTIQVATLEPDPTTIVYPGQSSGLTAFE